MIIRDLEPRDIPQLLSWLREFNSSFDYPGKAPIDTDCATAFFASFLDNPRQAAFIAEDDGKPVAALGFAMLAHPWNGKSIFFKGFWYSAKPKAGRLLLRHAREVCEAANIDQMVVSAMDARTERLLRREGFKPCEMNLMLILNGN